MRDEPKKKLSAKKIILAGIAVMGVAIVVAALGLGVFYLVTFTTYRSAKDGLEIPYVRSWGFKAHPEKDIFVVFVAPKENPLDMFYETVNFTKFDMIGNVYTTEKYVETIVEQLEMVFGDVRIVQKAPFFVAGRSGYRLIFNVAMDVPKVMVVYAFTVEDVGYQLLYMGDANRLSKDLPIADMMALTMKFNPWVI